MNHFTEMDRVPVDKIPDRYLAEKWNRYKAAPVGR